MKKKCMLLAVLLLLAAIAAGCGHLHQWQEASCEEPKTCGTCGETEGEPLEHSWKAATCEAPETCEICGKTRGDKVDHSWETVSCEEMICAICAEEMPGFMGHDWVEATCEAPMTCSICGQTFGSPSHVLVIACGEPKTCELCGWSDSELVPHQGLYNYKLKENSYSYSCGSCGENMTVQVNNWRTAASDLNSGIWRCAAVYDYATGKVKIRTDDEMDKTALTFDAQAGTAQLVMGKTIWNGSCEYVQTVKQYDGSVYLEFKADWENEVYSIVLEGGSTSMKLGVIEYPVMCISIRSGDSVLYWIKD